MHIKGKTEEIPPIYDPGKHNENDEDDENSMEEEAVVDEDARKLYDKILGDFKKDSLIDSV